MTLIIHRLVVCTLLSAALIGLNRAQADEWEAASQIINQASVQMLELLDSTANKTEIFASAQLILEPVISFETISRGVMGKFFRRANDDQKKRFEKVLKQTLLQTYIAVLSTYKIEAFTINPNPVNEDKVNYERVWVKVVAGGSAFDIYYSMRLIDSQWKLTNLIIDGVNLGLVFRTQFASAMNTHNSDMNQVIEKWLSS
jgi:phospholipid transport system substrate-binding protein